jgi:CheY-like chemotaxis protein
LRADGDNRWRTVFWQSICCFCVRTMAKLVVIENGQLGLSHDLGKHWVTIGRAADNSFQLLEASVSGHHCEVRFDNELLTVRDLRSTNGTFLRGHLVTEGKVHVGESFRVGEVKLKLESSATAPVTISIDPVDEEKAVEPPPASGKRVSVLLVDDSKAFLEVTSELFRNMGGRGWDVQTAAAADDALAILQQREIDLVVLDVVMPMLDGVQLLKLIHHRHPAIKKVILTGNLNESTRADCLANGAELFLEKPAAPDGYRFIFNVLDDLIVWTEREGFTGTLRHVSLTDVIQIECLGGRSCILEVNAPGVRGEIYIKAGTIVHATAGTLSGDPAFHRLLALVGGDFHLQNYRDPKERTVRGTWEYLLIEAARLRDEERTLRASADTLRMVKEPVSGRNGAGEEVLPDSDDEFVVVSTYDGQWHQEA